jgi:NTE family protein
MSHLPPLPELPRKPSHPVLYGQTALVLQGGGALGAYQAGAYEVLAAGGYHPDWLSGISIGAINAAIIAGNEPAKAIERLEEFWTEATSGPAYPDLPFGNDGRALANLMSASTAMLTGAPGFFQPRLPHTLFSSPGTPEALSFYDTAPLRRTLERLVDFGRINARKVRLSLGAVNIRTGIFVYFDNYERPIGPEHVMASGALPPGFPPVEIDGDLYWDGGLVSNTPLTPVLSSGPQKDTLIFQIDLFSARGAVPRDLFEAEERRKDIVFSSRTRLNTDEFRREYALRRAITALYNRLPPEVQDDPDVRNLRQSGEGHAVAIVHLIYRDKIYETQSKDYDFSRTSMLDHWTAGRNDEFCTLQHPDWLDASLAKVGVRVFDLCQPAKSV